jgi:hypothetical protein
MTDSADGTNRVDERLVQLADSADGLGERRGAGRTGDRWLALAGGAGIGLGLVAIVLGWYGSAQSTLDFEQTPYLISGGLLGLALVVAGGLLYVCAWLTRLVRDNQAAHARTAAHQDRVERALAELAARRTSGADEGVVVTEGGTMLHRPTCAATAGQAVRTPGPTELALPLCGLCRPARPEGAPAPRPARRPRTRKAPAA